MTDTLIVGSTLITEDDDGTTIAEHTMSIQDDIQAAFLVVEGALPALGQADLVPLLSSLQALEAKVAALIAGQGGTQAQQLQAEVAAADTAAQIAINTKFKP